MFLTMARGLAEENAALNSPRSQEIVGKVDLLSLVKLQDALDAVFVAIDVGNHRMGREIEAFGFENQMVGDPSRCRHVLF
jgi:hypothetical protein